MTAASARIGVPSRTCANSANEGPPAGARLMRNTTWSCIGSAAPMLVAFVDLPRLIQGLGADRFGILTLAWMAIGYLSLSDFGLGRAITRLIADLALGTRLLEGAMTLQCEEACP
jgi:O-antigen/teichoic acid export membrane protein